MIRCNSDYLKLIGAKFIAGRNLDDASVDDFGSSYVVNEAAAKEFGWSDAIGKQIVGPVGPNDEADHEGQVVGVVKDFNFSSLYNRVDPLILILGNGFRYLYVKLDGKQTHELIPQIQSVYTKMFPEYPFEWEFLDSKYKSLYQRDYDAQLIFRIGTLISFIISCLGIFSISSLIARLRQKESGIRKIVGASTWQLFVLHVMRFSVLLLVALLIACPTIFVLSRYWLNSFAYRIELSLIHFLIPTALAAITSILIAGFHGARSARVNPADVLRAE
jgi:putative ABC transport system permease protein